ncbi:hypothetical protein PINS_up013899 [Pythium insidiosum]|nr:hypothetical protein PINS_up013899 [Pythium insidiosum]
MAFFMSKLTSFPAGLLHPDIPPNMGLTIYGCNISELPADMGDVWATHKWPYLWLDYNNLRSLPASFSKMRLRRLSLVYNQIEQLDDEMFANFEFYRLRLTGNPLTRLPKTLGNLDNLQRLALENTSISALPSWVEEWWTSSVQSNRQGLAFSVMGTPLCAHNSSNPMCQPIPFVRANLYPFQVIAEQRVY